MSTFFNWFNSSAEDQEPSETPIKKRHTNENIAQELTLVQQVKDATDRLYNYLLDEAEKEPTEQDSPRPARRRRKRQSEVEMLESQFAGWKK